MKLPKIAAIIAIAVAVFGGLNSAEVLTLVPKGMASIITVVSAVAAALSSSIGGGTIPVSFPKIVGILGVIASVFGALNTAEVLAMMPHGVASIVTVGGVLCAALSRSLGGDGQMFSVDDKP